ncbi:hypothetical protein GQ457_11G032210 [Hibiscus cannabinus]
MSQSIDKPPYFNGAHYSHWKNRMMIFVQSVDYLLWDIIEDGPTIPMKRVGELQIPKERHEWTRLCVLFLSGFCLLGSSMSRRLKNVCVS